MARREASARRGAVSLIPRHVPWSSIAFIGEARGAILILCLACSRGEPGTVVEFWALGREGEHVRALVPAFEARHPGVTVRVQQIPWSAAHEKLLTAFVGDALPDVIQLGNTWIPEFAALGALAPLEPWLAKTPALDAQDFFPGVLDAAVIDGATLAVPWYADTRLLFYRSDWFAAGLPGAWPAWLAEAERVQARLGPGQHALLLPLGEWEVPVALALQHGAALLRDGDRYGNFASPEFRAAFAFYLSPVRARPRAAHGRGAAREPAPGLRGRRVRRARHRAVEPARVRGAAAGGDADEVGDGAAARLRGARPRRLARGRREPRARREVGAAGGGLGVDRVPRRARAAGGVPPPVGRPARAPLGVGRPGARGAARRRLPGAARARASPRRSCPEWERIASRIAWHTERAVREGRDPDAVLAALDADADQILDKRRSLLARRERPE